LTGQIHAQCIRAPATRARLAGTGRGAGGLGQNSRGELVAAVARRAREGKVGIGTADGSTALGCHEEGIGEGLQLIAVQEGLPLGTASASVELVRVATGIAIRLFH
jgi:hypothetical protein